VQRLGQDADRDRRTKDPRLPSALDTIDEEGHGGDVPEAGREPIDRIGQERSVEVGVRLAVTGPTDLEIVLTIGASAVRRCGAQSAVQAVSR
jgi:hypothetical protein